jgi:hypothetical protein
VRTHYGVIYDQWTLAPRRVILSDDPAKLFNGTHARSAVKGEVYCTIQHAFVAHLLPNLGELAREAVRRHSGREPPTMAEVHATDARNRGS